MYYTKVTITNFKSIGEKDNTLKIERDITTIIGKNESGKSNLLSALSQIQYDKVATFSHSMTNYLSDKTPSIIAELEFDDDEKAECISCKTTVAKFEHGHICKITGGWIESLNADETLNILKNYIIHQIKSSNRISDKNKFLGNINNLNVLNHNSFKSIIKELKDICGIMDSKDDFLNAINEMVDRYTFWKLKLPNIFLIRDSVFKDRYSVNDILNMNIQDSIFRLFIVADISINDVLTAANPNTEAGKKLDLKIKIQRKLDKISKEFNKYYSNNNIKIQLNIENGYFELLVDNGERPIKFSEHSNGLQWYLGLFLQLKEKEALLNNNNLILIDEPGVSLHIDAQKEALQLFESLTCNNQIIYTTHSPFLIDTENLGRIRLIENKNGITLIHNKPHSADIEEVSKKEILSPIIKALGFSTRYNIGPAYDKINYIVEGITDYYYMKGIMEYFGIPNESMPNIIPSVGVDCIHNIVSILIGWGCPFKVITDYDNQAYKELVKLQKLHLEEGKELFCINLKKINQKDMMEKPFVVENLFAEDKDKFEISDDKYTNAYNFYDACKKKTIQLSEGTKSLLKELLKKIFDIKI